MTSLGITTDVSSLYLVQTINFIKGDVKINHLLQPICGNIKAAADSSGRLPEVRLMLKVSFIYSLTCDLFCIFDG